MKLLWLFIAAVLTSSGLTSTIRTKRQEKMFEAINFSMTLSEFIAMGVGFAKSEHLIETFLGNRESADPEKNELGRIYADLLLLTTVDGRTPTEDQLKEIAKRMSIAYKKPYWLREARGRSSMRNESIAFLKRVVKENPIRESGNNYVELIGEEDANLNKVAEELKNIGTNWKTVVTDSMMEKESEWPVSWFLLEFILVDYIRLRRSEQHALYSIKNFAVLVDTLKDPASYGSLTTFRRALGRSKYFDAWMVVASEAVKCIIAPLSQEDQAEFYEHVYTVLRMVRYNAVDRTKVDPEEELSVDEAYSSPSTKLRHFSDMIEQVYKVEKNRDKFAKCILGEKDRKLFKEIIFSNFDLIPEDKLEELKGENEKVHAVVSLVNNDTRALRNLESLSEQADKFLKELETTPHALLWMSKPFSPFPEVVDKMQEERNKMIHKFNDLPDEVKDELVEAFPYRAFLILTMLP